MSATGLEVFDTTLQKTNQWLSEIMNHLGSRDRHKAYLALRATLHAFRDRLNADEVAQLGAQLPMLIRGMYYEGWDPSEKPRRSRGIENFLIDVQRQLSADALVDAETAARAVFKVLEMHVSPGEIEKVRHVLPAGIRELFPMPRETAAESMEDPEVASTKIVVEDDVLTADRNERYAG